jgi:ParB-like chromosome segregation protein Spo0J
MNEDHALHLAELVDSGVKVPPIEVAKAEDDNGYIVVDGRHRLHAYSVVLDRKSIPSVIVKGTQEELLLRSLRANTGGSLTTGGSDINLVIKQLLRMGVAKVKIIQQMSLPNLRDKLVAAQQAVVEGMTAPTAAEKFGIPLGRLQTLLSGSRKRKTQIEDLSKVLTKTAFTRSKVISNAINKALEMFDDGELRATQVQKLLDQLGTLNKRSVKSHQNLVARFEERKRLLKSKGAAA